MKRQRIYLMLLIFGIMLCLCGCGFGDEESVEPQKAEIFAMDTIMDFTVYGDNAEELLNEARQMVSKYENLFSVNIEDSDVAKINEANGKPIAVSNETYELLSKSIEVSKQTDGIFDVSIYPLVRAWGFTTKKYRVPTDSEKKNILRKVDYRKISLEKDNMVSLPQGMEIDLGGIAKGYLSQKLIEYFKNNGAKAAIVSLGGNVQTCGTKPDGSMFQVGITDPADGTSVLGKIEIGEKAVITSGAYQRYFEKDGVIYHHIMDKRTGAPADSDLKSVTVIANQGERADSLATALFVMGKEKAIAYAAEHNDIQLILVGPNDEIWTSDGVKLEK